MHQIVTHENLIRYAYNETGLTESVVLQIAIDEDPEVEATFASIVSSLHYLDALECEPSDALINKILALA